MCENVWEMLESETIRRVCSLFGNQSEGNLVNGKLWVRTAIGDISWFFDMTESIWNVTASPPEWNTWQVNNSSQIWFWSLCVIVHSDSEGTWFETWLVIQPFYRHNCPLKGNGQSENSHWPGRFRFRTSLAGTASLDDAPPAADGRIPVLDVKLPSTPSISASVGLKGNKVWATRLNRSKHAHYHQTWIST